MSGPVDLLVLLDLLINSFICLLPFFVFFLVGLRGATTEAPHDIRTLEPGAQLHLHKTGSEWVA